MIRIGRGLCRGSAALWTVIDQQRANLFEPRNFHVYLCDDRFNLEFSFSDCLRPNPIGKVGRGWMSESQLPEAIFHLDLFRSRTCRVHAFGVDSVLQRPDKVGASYGLGLSAFDTFQKLTERHLKGSGQSRQVTETDLTRTSLEVRYMDLVNTRLFGKIDLPPTPFLSELPDSFAKLDANIKRHSSSIDLVEALYLVDALSREIRAKDRSVVPVSRVGPGVPGSADDTTAVAGTTAQSENPMNSSTREGIAAMRCGPLEETG